ncbi:MAG: DUF371 domain-containing protein [Candidatus Helarchaeota archaeon]
MTVIEEFYAFGHTNILATHKTTFEFTKEETISKRGNCIIGVAANKSISDISEKFKAKAKKRVQIRCILMVDNLKEEILGYGHEALTFSHPTDIVIRKSNYICPRTLMIRSNKAAKDLDRKFIELIKKPETQINIKLIINS